jgi:hypothetical protein
MPFSKSKTKGTGVTPFKKNPKTKQRKQSPTLRQKKDKRESAKPIRIL